MPSPMNRMTFFGAVADGSNALCAAVLSQFRNGLAVQIVSGSFVGERPVPQARRALQRKRLLQSLL